MNAPPSKRTAIRHRPCPMPSQRSTVAVAGRPFGSLNPTLTRVPGAMDVVESPPSHHGEPSSRVNSASTPISCPSASSVAVPGTNHRGSRLRSQRKRVRSASRAGQCAVASVECGATRDEGAASMVGRCRQSLRTALNHEACRRILRDRRDFGCIKRA
jgi:hypothetical protein